MKLTRIIAEFKVQCCVIVFFTLTVICEYITLLFIFYYLCGTICIEYVHLHTDVNMESCNSSSICKI